MQQPASAAAGTLLSARSSRYSMATRLSMNVRPNLRMDKAAFIAWMAANEGRYELAGGRVVMMPGVSRAHGMLVMNVASLLRDQLDRTKWTVIAAFGLDAGPQTLRYPDIVVDRAGGGAKELYCDRAGTPRRGAVAFDSGNRPGRQGSRVSADTEPVRLHRAVAGRAEGLGVGARNGGIRSGACGHRADRGDHSHRRTPTRAATGGDLRRHHDGLNVGTRHCPPRAPRRRLRLVFFVGRLQTKRPRLEGVRVHPASPTQNRGGGRAHLRRQARLLR
jgi:Putative restriction endonuclease